MAFKIITTLVIVLLIAISISLLLPQSAMNSHGNASSHTGAVTVTAQISLSISPSPTTYSAVGATITNTYTIKNIGSVNILGTGAFTVTDSILGAFSCGTGPLAVNATTSCTKGYTVVQSNLDTGSISFSGSVSGNGATSGLATAPIVTAVQSPALTLSKSPSPTTFTTAGQQIQYTFGVTNSGNVTFPGPFTVTDNTFGSIATANCTGGGTLNGPLAPGASINCIFNYNITPTDVNNQAHNNQARVTALTYGNGFNCTVGQCQSATVNASITCPSCAGVNTISVTSAPYNATCNNTGNDQPGVQAALTAAGGMASLASPWTVTIPSGGICLMGSFSVDGSGGGRNLTIPSFVTLETAPGFTSKATILQTVAGRPTLVAGQIDRADVIGIGDGGQDAKSQTPHPVLSGVAGSNVLTMTNSGDSSAFFHVNDLIYIYDQVPTRSFAVTNITWSGNTANMTISGSMPTNVMYTNQLVGYICNGSGGPSCGTAGNGAQVNPGYVLAAGYTTTTATATFSNNLGATSCSGSCGTFQLCAPCDVQYAQEDQVTAVDADGVGTLHLLKPIIKAFPWQGRQAVVMNVNSILTTNAGLHDLIIQGAGWLIGNQSANGSILRNTFITDTNADVGLPMGALYLLTPLIESQFNYVYDSNTFTTTGTGDIGWSIEWGQRNTSYGTYTNNSFGTSTTGHTCYGEAENGGGNFYQNNTYWIPGTSGGCGGNPAIAVAAVNDTFDHNTIHLLAPYNSGGTSSCGIGNNCQNFILQDAASSTTTENDAYFSCCSRNLQLTNNTITNCEFTNDGSSSGWGNSSCVLLFGQFTTYNGNSVTRQSPQTPPCLNNSSGNSIIGTNTCI